MTSALIAALVLANVLALAPALSSPFWAQTPGGQGRRTPPPQPQQTQSPAYFVGTWRFSWTGRESPITPGPRSGIATFARDGNVLTMRVEGRIEEGAAYKESGTIEWNEAKKSLAFQEQLGGGAQLTGTGNWSSPLAIVYESAPLRVKTEAVRLRRSYAIISPDSFIITEELSIDGGPFVRLGTGTFAKAPRP